MTTEKLKVANELSRVISNLKEYSENLTNGIEETFRKNAATGSVRWEGYNFNVSKEAVRAAFELELKQTVSLLETRSAEFDQL